MSIYHKLLLAHLMLDYPLQGEFMAMVKAKNNFILACHAALWALGISLVLDLSGLYSEWMFWFLFIGHGFMDWLKCHKLPGWIDEGAPKLRFSHEKSPWLKDNLGLSLWIDQTWHLVQLAICVWMA